MARLLSVCYSRQMHPFPAASDLQFLIGKELEQIGLGYWQIQFNFDGARIIADGDIEHVASDGAVRRHNTDAQRLAPIYLHHLLGQRVRALNVDAHCLTIMFVGGDMVRIFGDDGAYECGQIYNGDILIAVF